MDDSHTTVRCHSWIPPNALPLPDPRWTGGISITLTHHPPYLTRQCPDTQGNLLWAGEQEECVSEARTDCRRHSVRKSGHRTEENLHHTCTDEHESHCGSQHAERDALKQKAYLYSARGQSGVTFDCFDDNQRRTLAKIKIKHFWILVYWTIHVNL